MTTSADKTAFSAAEKPATIDVRLVGGFRVSIREKLVAINRQKSQAILALLALAREGRCARDELKGLLWADSGETEAQTSLRNAIWFLNKTLVAAGADPVGSDRHFVWIDPAQIRTDIRDIEAAAAAGEVHESVLADPQLGERLLAGLSHVTEPFEERVNEVRAALIRAIRAGIAARLKKVSSAEDRLPFLNCLVAMDPLDEGACRDLIGAQAELGQIANALSTYQALWLELDRQFGEEPAKATQDLIVRIKMEASEPAEAASPARAAPSRPRIVVATADDHPSLRTTRSYLLACLARFREWKVFDSSLMRDDAIRNLAETEDAYSLSIELPIGAGAQAETCQALLQDLGTGELLWSESFPVHAPDDDNLSPDFVRRLAIALNIHLTTERHRQISAIEGERAGPYHRWLSAQDEIMKFTSDSWRRAERHLDKLIADYPDYSRGYASRASIENFRQINFPGSYSTRDMHVKALALAGQAITLDPMDSRAQLAMGWSCAMARQFPRAELAFDLAFRYNENDPWTICSSATGLAFCDQIDTAVERVGLMERLGYRLGPEHLSFIAAVHFMAGNYRECIKASERAPDASHDVPAWHAAALAHERKTDAARTVAQHLVNVATAAWSGPKAPSREDIVVWLLSGLPIRNRKVWEALRDGIHTAGLPIPKSVAFAD